MAHGPDFFHEKKAPQARLFVKEYSLIDTLKLKE